MTEARDVEELLSERGLEVDHTTIWHWVQRYGPELEERLRHHLKPTNKSWRVDETLRSCQGPLVLSCALGFSWTLDCERVLAGGVSR